MMNYPRINNKNTDGSSWLLVSKALLLILSLSLPGCQNGESQILPLSKMFVKLDSLTFDSKFQIGAITDVKRLNDSLLVFTDFSSRGIYFANLKSRKTIRVGSNGQGPGEYVSPDKLDIVDGKIFFNDLRSSFITVWDSAGNFISKKAVSAPISKFCIGRNSSFNILSSLEYNLYIFDESDELSRKLFKIEKDYRFTTLRMHGGGICLDSSGNLYFSNAANYEIVKLDTNLTEISRFRPSRSGHYQKLPDKLRKKNPSDNLDSRTRELIGSFTHVAGIYCLGGQRDLILVSLRSRQNAYLDLWTSAGQLITSLKVGNDEFFTGADQNQIFTTKYMKKDSTSVSLVVYIYELERS